MNTGMGAETKEKQYNLIEAKQNRIFNLTSCTGIKQIYHKIKALLNGINCKETNKTNYKTKVQIQQTLTII